jgi:uncharacterized membrane protein YdbT with pleckstrin-like domain
MNKFIKKLFGIDKIETATAEANALKIQAEENAMEAVKAAIAAKAKAEMATKTPKEIATEKKEPWVTVLETHVNSENVRNGFFELDWNEYFIVQLRSNGYQGDNEEAIVDKWFQDLCRNIVAEEGVSMERRGSGFINVNDLGNGKSEVS